MHQKEVLALLTVVKTCEERFTGPANEALEGLNPLISPVKYGGAEK